VALMLLVAARAQAAEVPTELGLLVMLKVLTYDAGFEARAPAGEFLVLVPFEPHHADQARALVREASTLPTKAMAGRALKFETVPAAELEEQLVARNATAVLVLSATDRQSAKTFATLAARHKRYAMTLNEVLVGQGVLLGVALTGGKAQVILNIGAAKQTGAEFSPAVMRIARLLQ